MLLIETTGSWREMGRQYGEHFREKLNQCMDHYCPWLKDEAQFANFRRGIARIRAMTEQHCPELIDESAGMAEALGIDDERMLGYRFFNQVRAYMGDGCSNVFMAKTDLGPLLARNNDGDKGLTPEIQVCRVCRPTDDTATISTTYMGLVGAAGMNEHGLAVGGSSAHTTDVFNDDGLPGGVLGHMIFQRCRDVEEVTAMLSKHTFRGKSQNTLIGDASGRSRIFEFVSGRTPYAYDAPGSERFNVCTNTFLSGKWTMPDEKKYQESSYARYGRAIQRLQHDQVAFTLSGLQDLMREIAMPGPVCSANNGNWVTAYSVVMAPAQRKIYVSFGHPTENAYKEVTL